MPLIFFPQNTQKSADEPQYTAVFSENLRNLREIFYCNHLFIVSVHYE